MQYNATLLEFRVVQQKTGMHQTNFADGVQTEYYHNIPDGENSNHVKIEVITTINVGGNYWQLFTESVFKFDNYNFKTPIIATDKEAIELLAKLSVEAHKLHMKDHDSRPKNPMFEDSPLPIKSEQELIYNITERVKAAEIKPGQNN